MGSVATDQPERTAGNTELRADLVRLLQLVTDHPEMAGPLEPTTLRLTASSAFIHQTADRLSHRVEARRAGDNWMTESVTLDLRRLHVVLHCTRRINGTIGTDRREASIMRAQVDDQHAAQDQGVDQLADRRAEARRGEL